MSKLLSQEEVDALLSQEAGPEFGEDLLQKEKEARLYDFRHPDRVSKEQLKILRNIHDNFARLLSTYLSNALRTMIDVKVPTIEQVTYLEFTMSASDFTYMYIFDITNLDGSAILETDPNLSFFIIDRLFGGSGSMINRNEGTPTIIERSVMNNVSERILEYLKEAWQHIDVLQPNILTFETNPQLVTIAPASETMIVLNFPVIARNFEFYILLCFPYFMLEPILKKLISQNYMTMMKKETNEEDVKNLTKTIENTNINFSVELGKLEIDVEDFIELEEGEILLLNSKIKNPLIARIQNHKKFLVSPGKKGKQRAVRIENMIDEEGDVL
ncbi:MAG: flagellar motor switch protein FliM [Candidatus Cloacimonetes bacterium]|nr:flagellar motor switch protein FliM [Candidatus Cloacimonadota bacterium]MDD4155594.1 flagellar motor switch protein FliM [Candidatus Cloacimonadota bacterium]